MLTEALKKDIRSAFESAKQGIDNFKPRGAQNKMIAEIAKTLAGDYDDKTRIACIEAPTGVGKTIAYLISGIIIAKTLKKTLVISSANINLQQQLLNKDIPDIAKHSQLNFSYALAKGRSRYLCIRNLINLTEDNQQDTLFDVNQLWQKPPERAQIAQLQSIKERYSNQEWSGDRDTLTEAPDDMLWQKIAANRQTCSQKRCQFYQDCCFFKARYQLNEVDVIIANHDLVLADLASTQTILPKTNDCIFIFDEAHHLAKCALNHFSLHCQLNGIDTLLEQNLKLSDQINKRYQLNDDLSKLQEQHSDLNREKNNLLVELKALPFDDQQSHRFKNGLVSDDIKTLGKQMLNVLKTISHHLNTLNQRFDDKQKQAKIEAQTIEIIQTNLNNQSSQFDHFTTVLKALIADDALIPKCRWLKKNDNQEIHIHITPIDVSSYLNELIWSDCGGAILTSATLTSLGNFTRFNARTGLANIEQIQYLKLSSPFHYQQVPLTIAKINSQPNDADFTDEVASELLERIDNSEGSLVLFSSNQQMQTVAMQIEKKLNCPLYIQGEFSKQAILEKHIKNRLKNKGSIIFGLDSFAEGVDLPGDYLTHVMIVKLRFSVPTSPIAKATEEYLKSQGINAFQTTSLPDASLHLIQACGRLLRHENDYGRITIFDRRLLTKSYGQQLLAALPPFKLEIEKQ